MKSEILKLRKQIYYYLKSRAHSYEDGTAELEAYQTNQDTYADREFKICTMDNLLNTAENSDIIYIGDFHTFDQNIRNVLRIIKLLVTKNKRPIIGLEMVDHSFQLVLDTYLEGHLTELEFLEEVNYHNSWRFPWTHYKLIFELARKHDIQIVALNKQGTLNERDKFAAQLLKGILENEPDASLVVLYGELHISPNKIPALTSDIAPNLKQLIIHQNLDKVYWKLAEDQDKVEAVCFNPQEFCLLTAPPWVKYESMVYWYENLCNDPEFDIHSYIIENGKKIFSDDTHENFILICIQIINFLKLNIEEDEIENFNLYDHTNLDYVEETLSSSLNENLVDYYEYLIATNRSFRFLENKFYCSSYSMNRISYLAGIHILHFYLEKKGLNALSVFSSNKKDSFFTLITLEAILAYFFSKIINPHRKCDMYLDYQRASETKITKNILNLFETKNFSSIEKLTLEEIYEVATPFGHILGEYLYLREAHEKSTSALQELLDNLSFHFEDFISIRDKILKPFEYEKHQKRYF